MVVDVLLRQLKLQDLHRHQRFMFFFFFNKPPSPVGALQTKNNRHQECAHMQILSIVRIHVLSMNCCLPLYVAWWWTSDDLAVHPNKPPSHLSTQWQAQPTVTLKKRLRCRRLRIIQHWLQLWLSTQCILAACSQESIECLLSCTLCGEKKDNSYNSGANQVFHNVNWTWKKLKLKLLFWLF